ncbi:MAG: TlpA disulfide reductase family protein [Chitinophagaceae bacterium]
MSSFSVFLEKKSMAILGLFIMFQVPFTVFSQQDTVGSERITLKVGDPAPIIKPQYWIKGEPVSTFLPGKVYVVDLWATWCVPCAKTLPFLTNIKNQYQDKVVIISANVMERSKDDKYWQDVNDFVKRKGLIMDGLSVCADGNTKSVESEYFRAAGLHEVPGAFVVTQEGKIGYIGSPLYGTMDKAIALAVEGKLDIKTGEMLSRQTVENRTHVLKLQDEFGRLMNGQPVKALEKFHEIETLYPEWAMLIGSFKYRVLKKIGTAESSSFAVEFFERNFNNDLVLMEMANFIVRNDSINGDKSLVLKMALRAYEIQKASPSYAVLDLSARALAQTGRWKEAVGFQEQAVAVAPEEVKLKAKDMLKLYRDSI